MEGLIDVVRSDISRLTRCTIEALVVLEVHSRDVVEMLVNTNVSSHMDFSWLK
jgi:dynein heavy chain, axonemal